MEILLLYGNCTRTSRPAADPRKADMLIGIDPLLSGSLLATLREMGHGDEIAIVDANFPAAHLARRLHRLDGADLTRALKAILSVMPLDDFGGPCAWRMQPVAAPGAGLDAPVGEPPIFDEMRALLRNSAQPQAELAALERQAFYGRAREAFAIVATAEARLYGNLLLRKGVIRPGAGA
jgi:L-fucose mutarotase